MLLATKAAKTLMTANTNHPAFTCSMVNNTPFRSTSRSARTRQTRLIASPTQNCQEVINDRCRRLSLLEIGSISAPCFLNFVPNRVGDKAHSQQSPQDFLPPFPCQPHQPCAKKKSAQVYRKAVLPGIQYLSQGLVVFTCQVTADSKDCQDNAQP